MAIWPQASDPAFSSDDTARSTISRCSVHLLAGGHQPRVLQPEARAVEPGDAHHRDRLAAAHPPGQAEGRIGHRHPVGGDEHRGGLRRLLVELAPPEPSPDGTAVGRGARRVRLGHRHSSVSACMVDMRRQALGDHRRPGHAGVEVDAARRPDHQRHLVGRRNAVPLVAHLAPPVEGDVGGHDDEAQDVEEVPRAGSDHDVGRVPATDEVVEGQEQRTGQGHPAEPVGHAERADPFGLELADDEVAVERRGHRHDVADVGEDVDAHRRAEEAHDDGADHVERHGPVRHVVLVLVLEELRAAAGPPPPGRATGPRP